MIKNFNSEDFVHELMSMTEMERSDTIQELFNSKTIDFAKELDNFSNEFSATFSNALEADSTDPDAGADDKGDDDKGTDPDAGSNDKDSDPDSGAGDDAGTDPDAGGGDEGGTDPDFTKGADPDAGGGANPDAGAGGGAAPSGGDVEPPKNEEEKEEKNKDISERIHLFKNYKRLAAMNESLVNGMQGFIDYALSIEDRNVVLRIKQELIKTSGQLDFAMALNFKTADKEKLTELYDIINKKIQKFIEALEKVRKAKQNPQK